MHLTTPIYTHTPPISLPTGQLIGWAKCWFHGTVPRNIVRSRMHVCGQPTRTLWPWEGYTVQPGLGLHTLYPQQPYFVQALIPTYTHIYLDKPYPAIPNYTHNNTHT